MNIAVKIKVVEETQLYRKIWISRSRDCPGGELWKVDGRKLKIFNVLPFDSDLDFHGRKSQNEGRKFQVFFVESRAFICIMNIVVKIKVVEETKLYRKFWISRSRSYAGGELWNSWRLKVEIFRLLPFDDFLWLVFMKQKFRIESPNFDILYV